MNKAEALELAAELAAETMEAYGGRAEKSAVGNWALKAGGTTTVTIDVVESQNGEDIFAVRWHRPGIIGSQLWVAATVSFEV